MKELTYISCPSRLNSRKKDMMDFVSAHNKGPLHPFNAYPFEYFEGGNMGRERTIELCCLLTDICAEMWVFGISEGVLIEVNYFLSQNDITARERPLRVHVKQFDPEWQKHHGLSIMGCFSQDFH